MTLYQISFTHIYTASFSSKCVVERKNAYQFLNISSGEFEFRCILNLLTYEKYITLYISRKAIPNDYKIFELRLIKDV